LTDPAIDLVQLQIANGSQIRLYLLCFIPLDMAKKYVADTGDYQREANED
jgi:hypothetical protein